MLGRTIVILLCLGATLLSVPAVSPYGINNWISLAASSTAFVAMAINQFLATRPRLFEGWFGGLDRMYHFHRQIGMTALALMLVHYFFTPSFTGLQLNSGLNTLARYAGEYGFYGLVALAALSLVKRIPFTKWEVPYHLWRQSHRFIGIFFMIIVFHWLFIKRPFGGEALLVNYLTVFGIIGVASFLYTQIMPFLKRRGFEVIEVDRLPAATVVKAKPTGRGIRATPGQFGFLRVAKSGLGEPHPFTLAGIGGDGTITFAIKPLGDYTRRLRESIAVGDRIQIEGGHGRFIQGRGGDRQVWLAGGIGITPFLAMAESLESGQKRQIHLVHSVRNASEAVSDQRLFEIAKEVEGFSFVLHDSEKEGWIDAEKLIAKAPFEVDGSELWFCGPPPLRSAIVGGLKKLGKRFKSVKFERFEFR